MKFLTALGLLTLPAMPLAAQTLPDGLYGCYINGSFLGDIAIAGTTYAGPAFDGAFGDYYPFTTASDTITWGGPLGGISAAGTIVSTVLTDAGNNRSGFDVMIQNPQGNFQMISCLPDY